MRYSTALTSWFVASGGPPTAPPLNSVVLTHTCQRSYTSSHEKGTHSQHISNTPARAVTALVTCQVRYLGACAHARTCKPKMAGPTLTHTRCSHLLQVYADTRVLPDTRVHPHFLRAALSLLSLSLSVSLSRSLARSLARSLCLHTHTHPHTHTHTHRPRPLH